MTNPEERLRFTSITLKNWRNFADMTVELPRLAYLVGANGSGKSNLLDAFRFLHELGAVRGGLRAAVEDRGGMGSLRHLAAPTYAPITISVTVGSDVQPDAWGYELTFTGDEEPQIVAEGFKQGGERYFWRELLKDATSHERKFTTTAGLINEGNGVANVAPIVASFSSQSPNRTYLEQGTADMVAPALAELLDLIRYININPQIVRNPGSNPAGSNGAYGGALLEEINKAAENGNGGKVKEIERVLSQIVPEIASIQPARGSFDVPRLYTFFKHAREGSKPLTEAVLSDGTLRLIGMLWSLVNGDGPLLLEEPEQSLRAGLVQYVPLLLSGAMLSTGRQIMVSTHSTELLDSEGIEVEQVLMLQAEDGASTISQAASIEDAAALLMGGEHMSNLVLGLTGPAGGDLLATYATAGRYGQSQTNSTHDSKQGAEEGQPR